MTIIPGQTGAHLQPADVAQLLRSEIALLTADDFNAMSVATLQAFRMGQMTSVTPAAIAGFTPTTFSNLLRKEIAALTTEQIGALTAEQVGVFGVGKLGLLTAAQMAAFDPTALAALEAH